MPRRSRENPEVREFILRNVPDHPRQIAATTAARFGLSRTAVARYLQRLVRDGLLTAEGRTSDRHYALAAIVRIAFEIDVSRGTSEDAVWRYRIHDKITGLPQNVIDICQYGFTEMLNNVIDHSGSFKAAISYEQNYNRIKMLVADYGIGVFQKIQTDFRLPDARSALLELSKGKLTSDKKRHSGEGIFFTSRMFDQFTISSAGLFYLRERKDDDDWLIETGNVEPAQGTIVTMTLSTSVHWTPKDIFDKYQGDTLRFRRTHVPLKLGRYPGEQLVSRSQAKRILARFENFSEVLLDFASVDQIGQAFADEIFRVFKSDHPDIKLIAINTSADVEKMLELVTLSSDPNQPDLGLFS